jgi:hypothetical protein
MSGHSKAAACLLRVFFTIAIVAQAAACADSGAKPEMAAVPTGESMPTSAEDARTQCWMRYEQKGKQVKNLDEKIKLLDKCIEDKSKLIPTAASR